MLFRVAVIRGKLHRSGVIDKGLDALADVDRSVFLEPVFEVIALVEEDFGCVPRIGIRDRIAVVGPNTFKTLKRTKHTPVLICRTVFHRIQPIAGM